MTGIAKSTAIKDVYFVVKYFMGISVLYSGSLTECRAYCKKHGHPTKIMFDW